MLPFPFDPTELAPALPDVIAAIGVAFVLAIITFKPRRASATETALEAMKAAEERLAEQASERGHRGS